MREKAISAMATLRDRKCSACALSRITLIGARFRYAYSSSISSPDISICITDLVYQSTNFLRKSTISFFTCFTLLCLERSLGVIYWLNCSIRHSCTFKYTCLSKQLIVGNTCLKEISPIQFSKTQISFSQVCTPQVGATKMSKG